MDDLSKATDIRCLLVQAEHDLVIETFATVEATQRFGELLPPASSTVILRRGTHSGFGSYVPMWKPEVDGIPTEQQQQQEAVQATVQFLQGRLP